MTVAPVPSQAAPTRNPVLKTWVEEMSRLTKPDRIVWCDGSEAERARLTEDAVKTGVLLPLNPKKRPNSYLHRSNPNDVARVEQLTFICTPTKEEAGPTNHWMAPDEAYAKLRKLFDGSMKGRTMYVIPYVMGPIGSPYSKIGVELTDSIYVVLNMRIMTRMGKAALEMLGESADFNRGLHSLLDCNPERRFICHFPQDNTIWSIGSGYGGNVLLGKKCLALRIGSYLGWKEGWMAEHMLILGVENPQGETKYVAAAFPSACGKTNFAMMIPPKAFNGWKIWTVGDDIAWMRPGPDGRLWAINPEAGYFGVAPGTSNKSNPTALKTVAKDALFTNVALTPDKDVWWEGMDEPAPEGTIDWVGKAWNSQMGPKAAHPNSRFTVPATNNPMLSPRSEDPKGVPISAIIFGGRRADTVPLVLQSSNWESGVYLGATMGSETTAAAAGKVGIVRRDPMAMLPFCGYDMGRYLNHWLEMGKRLSNPPAIFMVNWFRKSKDGSFLWPGYGENMRVLKWMLDRIAGQTNAEQSALGWIPSEGSLELSGLSLTPEQMREATQLSMAELKSEFESHEEFFRALGPTVPQFFSNKRAEILKKIAS